MQVIRLLLFIVLAIVLCVLSLFDSVLPLWQIKMNIQRCSCSKIRCCIEYRRPR